MASLPTPRSLSQIIGRMADVFLSRFGARGVKPGSPVLGFIESAAQSDARNAQDIFALLEASDVDRATGEALDRHAQSVGLTRRGETTAKGFVTISDTTFTKAVAKVWQGAPAPIAGSTAVYLTAADSFPNTGNIYLGRGTSTYEGPIPYTAKTLQTDGVWKLTLGSATKRYHPVGENVVLAQGGNRLVPAGTVVSTPQGNVSDAVGFTLAAPITLLNGEDELSGVAVQCQSTGVVGNVSAGAISVVPSPSFVGMAVTNPNAISNALPKEDDASLRVRIKKYKQAKAKGTALAIETGAYGVQATDEASAVLSSKVVERRRVPSVLYVDDGTGYEEKASGIALEVLVDEALGGEEKFQLAYGRPVAKAFAQTSLTAPFALTSGSSLAVRVGGVLSTHTFDAASFDDIRAASAYEVVASINADADLLFAARTAAAGTAVAIFAKSETNDDIEVVTPSATDANTALGFPLGRIDTVRLYKNDVPLYKDGLYARVDSAPVSEWKGFTEGDTLIVSVDGTAEATYSFKAYDFLNTGFTSVSENNALEAWVAVINAKVPGITASLSGAGISLVSNLGANDRAAISIDAASTLVVKGMFAADSLSAAGKSNDFLLDRNLGQIELVVPLTSGDRLTAGSLFTRAYIQSGELNALTFGGTADFWFVVDGNTEIIQVGVPKLSFLQASGSPIKRFSALDASGAAVPMFTALKAGDWMVVQDSAFPVGYQKPMRISNVDPLGYWLEVDEATIPGSTTTTTLSGLTSAGTVFVRTTGRIQHVTATGSHTADTLADALNAQLIGATAVAYDTNWVRVMTNTYAPGGEVALVMQDSYAAAAGFASGVVKNERAQLAAIESGTAQGDLPAFLFMEVSAATGNNLTLSTGPLTGTQTGPNQWVGRWMRPDVATGYTNRYDANSGSTSILRTGASNAAVDSMVDAPVLSTGSYGGSLLALSHAYALTATDTLDVLLDNDETSKLFSIDMFRKTKPEVGSTYGTTIRLTDVDAGLSLSSVFGTGFDFRDFAVYMHPRVKVGNFLFRLNQFGPSSAVVKVVAPTAANQDLSISYTTNTTFNAIIGLDSGDSATVSLSTGTKMWWSRTSGSTYLLPVLPLTSITRSGSTVTVTYTAYQGVTDHGIQNGDTVYLKLGLANFPDGAKTATRISATQFSYTEAGTADTQSVPSSGFVSFISATPAATDKFASLSAGQWVNIHSPCSVSALLNTYSINSLPLVVATGVHSLLLSAGTVGTSFGVVALSDTSFSAYGASTTTEGQLATFLANTALSVTSLTSNPNELVTPIDGATFTDGLNYVNSSSLSSGNFSLTLKLPVSAGLGAPNDWANEEIRLVPTTAKNIVDYLSATSVTPLSAAGATVAACENAGRVQLTTGVLGSLGSIQVKGGTANEAIATMLNGSPVLTGSNSIITLREQDALPLLGSSYVAVQNAVVDSKAVNTTGTITIAGNKVTIAGSRSGGQMYGSRWYIEKHGPFACWMSANADGSAPSFNFSGYDSDWLIVPPSSGDWSTVGAANIGGAVAVELSDGRVLVTGGETSGTTVNTCFIYNPTTNVISAAAPMGTARERHTATLLADGRVLVAGGYTSVGATGLATGEVYNPTSNTWAAVGNSMANARYYHTETLASNGKVFLAGGLNASGAATSTVSYYDPSTNQFSAGTTALRATRAGHTATSVSTDYVLIAGGGYASTEFYDIANQLTIPGPDLSESKTYHAAVKLASGRILFIGGGTANVCYYDPNVFVSPMPQISPMHETHTKPVAVVLSDGKVFVSGGTSTRTGEMWDPAANEWAYSTNSTWNYTASSATQGTGPGILLSDGRVFRANGANQEVFDPKKGISPQNVGTFQIVKTLWDAVNGRYAFWVENPDAVDEYIGIGSSWFYTYDSVIPGDILAIGTAALGTANQGLFTVASVDPYDMNSFYVNTSLAAYSGAGDVLVTVQPPKPARFIKKAAYIHPYSSAQDQWALVLADQKYASHMSVSYETAVSSLMKLGFDTGTAVGADGYKYNTGLLAAVNKVIQGDEADPDTFPGIVSAGAQVNVSGPIVKRIRMSFDVRVKTGPSIKSDIQSAVAATVNGTPIGSPVAISAVVAAVQAVPGVEAVVVLSPSYGQGQDAIPVQPYEKAMVLNASTDITVNIIGQ